MYKQIFTFAAIAAMVAGTAATPASARTRGHSLSVQGSNGRGFTRSRSVAREPGSSSISRNLQTNGGRGYASTRGASWADGSYEGGRTTTLNNGRTFGRSTTATSNGDGSASYSTTRTGIDGQSSTVSGTVSRTPPQ